MDRLMVLVASHARFVFQGDALENVVGPFHLVSRHAF